MEKVLGKKDEELSEYEIDLSSFFFDQILIFLDNFKAGFFKEIEYTRV
jgi:hypothetical protein